MESETKYFFHEIEVGKEFIADSVLKTVLIKIDDDYYCIKGQTRQWRANKTKQYLKK